MASLNIAEWNPEQVAEWMSGLDESVAQYVPALKARGLDGAKLLTLRCDDLEYLGMHIIGHQELLLEAVEHLRNFQYELSRECIQQLALRVSVCAGALVRSLRTHTDARLDTQVLADVARTVSAVKPLACWLHRRAPAPDLELRRAALLRRALEAATCAMRDRFAEQPARAVGAAAAAAAAAATYIVREAHDPAVLQPAALAVVTLRRPRGPLPFRVRACRCGGARLARVRFGGAAHASGAVLAGDEIVCVGARCVLGWSGAAVERACDARAGDELTLRLRRRAPGVRAPVRRRARRELAAAESSASSGSERASPAPTPRPAAPLRAAPLRRHSVCGGSPAPDHSIHQFWQTLKEHRRGASPEPVDVALYARDKAVSCSTGLELAPRPRTVGGADAADERRGKLDKALSTPPYELEEGPPAPPLVTQVIPESPTTPAADSPTVIVHSALKADQILQFKKSSSVIGEAMNHRRPPDDTDRHVDTDDYMHSTVFEGATGTVTPGAQETWTQAVNCAVLERRRSPQPSVGRRDVPGGAAVLRAVPRDVTQHDRAPDYNKLHVPQMSMSLRHITKQEIRVVATENARPLPPLNSSPGSPGPPGGVSPDIVLGAQATERGALSPASAVRGIFPTSKSRSLKKKSSILAKRRSVPCAVVSVSGARGCVWQRVRCGGGGGEARWRRRTLVLAHGALYAYGRGGARAACMIRLAGCTAAEAGEVRSRPHAFKVYHTGAAFYFAAPHRAALLAWLQLIHRATLEPHHASDVSKQFSETEYSDTESESEWEEPTAEPEHDKSKFGSLKKLTRSHEHDAVPHSSTSLDRKYLRFFSRQKHKDEPKPKSKQSGVPVPTEHYRSYRRAPAPSAPAPTPTPAPTAPAPKKLPTPINYIHASNPNLLDFEKSDFVSRPTLQVPSKPKVSQSHGGAAVGAVTLEQFMLAKQAEEARQVYSERVLLGVRRDTPLQRRLRLIVPDVIYGEVCGQAAPTAPPPAPTAPTPAPRPTPPAPAPRPAIHRERKPEPGKGKPISVKGKDGYEKIVYTDEVWDDELVAPGVAAGVAPGVAGSVASSYDSGATSRRAAPPAPDRWRDSLRRNDKVHSSEEDSASGARAVPVSHSSDSVESMGGVSRLRLMFTRNNSHAQASSSGSNSGGSGGSRRGVGAGVGPGGMYPHLQCPPTFQPETYSLTPRQHHTQH